jgi:uncharacterized protein DUF6058
VSGDGFSEADIEYVRVNYRRLGQLCLERDEQAEEVRALIREGLLPAPSYVLPDGGEMVPEDYFRLVDEAGGPKRLRQEFERRYLAAGGEASELEEDWGGYIGGIYGVCLRHVSPETIVRKSELVRSIGRLLANPAPEDAAWQSRLRDEVGGLDALEREFSPDYDRKRFERPPSRDLLIVTARERYPELFAAEVGGRGR